MIGLYLELSLPDKAHALIIKILGWRYLFSAMLAALFFFRYPYPKSTRACRLNRFKFRAYPYIFCCQQC